MDARSHQHVISILNNYFASVKSLRTYLGDILQVSVSNFSLAEPDDTELFLNFLDTSYIGVKTMGETSCRIYSTMLDMREIVDRAQEKILRLKKTQNIITSGYRLAQYENDRGRKGTSRFGITNYFVNTIINVFHSPEWEVLLRRIGEDAMIHLLTETSTFLSLPNGCLCQITGEPLIHVSPDARSIGPTEPLRLQHRDEASLQKKRSWTDVQEAELQNRFKRRKVVINPKTSSDANKAIPQKFSSPADIYFSRVRMFYGKPNYVPHTTRFIVGLPRNHVLNRLEPSYLEAKDVGNSRSKLNPRKLAENARHLSKYVFARQYGLNSTFSSAPAYGFGIVDHMDREAEIKSKGHGKTPKRLKSTLPLLEKLTLYHSECRYLPLRDMTCPSKIKTTGQKDVDSSIILEMMSETSVQLRSQASLGNTSIDSNGNPIIPFGLTQARKHALNKPRFVEFACNYVEVYRYVVLVTKAVIPKALWGSKKNLEVVLEYVKEFISGRRFETLNLHHVLQGFSTTDCEWLMPPGRAVLQQGRVSVSDSLKRRELLEDFVFWYFDSFVIPLLKNTFYITESSAFRNKVLYFRQDDWNTLCKPLVERLTSVTFEKLTEAEATEILRQRRLGFSFVRLLPKETGVRPIVNLRRRKVIGRGSYPSERSINQILQAAFNILTYEKKNQSHLLGASIFNPDDIYLKLKKLKVALPKDANGVLPKLYFVKVDVKACFDTIDQTKLLQILRQIISEDSYMLQRYGQISTHVQRINRRYVKKAVPEDDHPHFIRFATDLADLLRNTIFVDQVVYPISKKQEILQLLEEHITENIVKIGQNYYRQMVGIPQGSVLSSILCSFFYGDLEKKFSKFTNDGQSMLLRMIDDYLYITTSLENAKEFLEMMKKGHPEYGCFISQEKTVTNFDAGDGSMNVVDPSQRTFPWCGYAIGMRDLSVAVDYTRYYGGDLRGTLTVDRGRRPGAGFAYKLMQLAKARSHWIYSDKDLNSWHIVYMNVYQNLLLTAIKMHEYINDWGSSRWTSYSFLRGLIEKTINYNYASLRARNKQKIRQESKDPGIQKRDIVWLGHHAFYHVLSRRSCRYGLILKWLHLEINGRNNRQYLRKFTAIVRQGQASLAPIMAR